jgi:ABC-type branched-subunit amino acid transport system substrate-binding protein
MTKRIATAVLAAVLLLAMAASAQKPPERDATREMLRATLTRTGPANGVDITFRQSDKQPYSFVGVLKTGIKNADLWEVVVSVSAQGTIHFRVYPHYKGGYVNLTKARDPLGSRRRC